MLPARNLIIRGLAILILLLVPSKLLAQYRIKVAFSAMTANNAPFWIALDKGFFKKNGLDVDLIYVAGGSRLVTAMLAGDAPIAHVGGVPIVTAEMHKVDLVFIGATVNKMLFQFFVSKGIIRPEDLKGKRVAVSRFGSGSDFAMRMALKELGLEPNKDVAILQLGGTPARLAALDSGSIQGTVLLPPENIIAEQRGFRLLTDLAASDSEFLNLGVATSKEFIASHPGIVRRFMRAYVEAIHFYKTREPESMEILSRHTGMENREVLKETYSLYQTVFQPAPYVTLKGVQNIIDDLAEKEPEAASISAQSLIENRFIKELDESGYIRSLYR